MLTLERLKELLTYDRSTGEFYWRDDRGPLAPKGSRAGTLNVGPMQGYVRICIDGKIYSAARLVWLYHHGSWPAHQVDHKDRDRANNRLENLREATPKQNMRNSSLFHSIDETNGEEEGNPSTLPAPKAQFGHDDDWREDHYGTRYAIAVSRYRPQSEWQPTKRSKG